MWTINRTVCLLWCICWGIYAQQDDQACTKNDPGTISSCYDKKKSKVIGETDFEINWSPQHITGNHTYVIKLMKLVAPKMYFENGSAHIIVRVPNLEKPLYNATVKASCHDVTNLLPPQWKSLSSFICPFRGNINITKPVKEELTLTSPEIPFPKGSYNITVKFYEKENPDWKKDPILLCLHGWLIIADVHPDHGACTKQSETTENPAEFIKEVLSQDDNSVGIDQL